MIKWWPVDEVRDPTPEQRSVRAIPPTGPADSCQESGSDSKAEFRRYLQGGHEALLWKLDGLSEYDVRRPVPVRHYKMYAAWAGEKAGRLKFNGHLASRSPLSNLEELEILRLGVEGKAAGWRTLRALAGRDPRLDPGQLDELIARARRQSGLLEELRVQAAADIIAARGRVR